MTSRAEIQKQLFPRGIPKLWCPTLSYFSQAHQFDGERIEQHLRQLAPHVSGLLVPGSTGEGWELSDDEIRELLNIVLPIAATLNIQVLIGILKTQTSDVLGAVDGLQDQIQHTATVGVTICPQQGAERTQSELVAGLGEVLSLGIPTAVYQLPQVTQNELHAASVSELAATYSNFILFKDTSGEDRVANSGVDLNGVFMLRGSERGGYSDWLRSVGGNYDGFLLSTANTFAPQLAAIISGCDAGDTAQREHARQLSSKLTEIVTNAFSIVQSYAVGNPFTNANKVIDHLLVYGPEFASVPTPMLLNGTRLPLEFVEQLANKFPELSGIGF